MNEQWKLPERWRLHARCGLRYIAVILALVLLNSCVNKQAKQESGSLGEYVYLDDNNVYHSRSTCVKLTHGCDDNGHEIYAMQPIDTADFYIKNRDYYRFCSRCVTDRIYEQMLGISERNSIAPPVEKNRIDWQE